MDSNVHSGADSPVSGLDLGIQLSVLEDLSVPETPLAEVQLPIQEKNISM